MENQNPDTRALPPGWLTQYDPNYRTWYYVNTKVQPPEITWNHPLDNRGYNQSPPFPSTPPKKSGPGMGTMMAVGAGGLLAGGLLGAAIADDENDAYMGSRMGKTETLTVAIGDLVKLLSPVSFVLYFCFGCHISLRLLYQCTNPCTSSCGKFSYVNQ
ncbi:hypothetical protein L218DRAFT_609983 [Marasmius fiardii PR-910]|nr:hypothetical protein L218DRAFT_609983 [Marasmius fiardii PR-910]